MENRCLISVIIPCYNQAQFLDQTLRSVFFQTYGNWECLIIDDGSTDGSKNIASNWCHLDSRFKYFFKVNGGLSNARNYGMNQAAGHVIQFLDADDLIHCDKFELQLLDLETSSISISDYYPFNNYDYSFVPDRYLSPFLDEKQYTNNMIMDWENKKSIPCHAILFKRALITKHHLKFNESIENHEDWVFWTQLFYYSDGIKNRNTVLAFYRIHGNSMTADYVAMRLGFIKAAKELEFFFSSLGEKKFKKLTRQKYQNIKISNKSNYFSSLFKKVYRKIKLMYQNV